MLGTLAAAGGAVGAEPPPVDESWLEYVRPLMTGREIEAYESLEGGFDRAAFAAAFWRSRDSDPESPKNEAREEWPERRGAAELRFGDLTSDRSRAFLLRGPPSYILDTLCPSELHPLEIWTYVDQEEHVLSTLLFVTPLGAAQPRLWDPGSDSVAALVSLSATPEIELERTLRRCRRGAEVLAAIEAAEGATALQPPDDAWLEVFAESLRSPLPQPLECELELHFPGASGRLTLVDGTIIMPGSTPETTRLRLAGDIYRGDRAADQFRYLFEPSADPDGTHSVTFRRHLPPGSYRLMLTVESVDTGRARRFERVLPVPAHSTTATTELPAARDGVDATPRAIRIRPLPSILLTGRQRVEASTSHPAIAKVRFVLDDRPVMTKSRPPFSIEVDLGLAPRAHLIEAIALAADGTEIARDRVPLNVGPHRFGVRLLEPRPGHVPAREASVRAAVEVPPDEKLDRVEFYVNDVRLATLYQPPFVLPRLPLVPTDGIGYVRAVAVLDDGHAAEDLIVVNAPGSVDRVQVDYVELYATVANRRGEAVSGLTIADFTVLEDGKEQQIRRLETVRDRSINAAIAVDTSTSMSEKMREAETAARRFLSAVVRPQDRAAVIVFSDQPHLVVPLTNDVGKLAAGLSDIEAGGETTLYDAVVLGLYYLSGLRGKRALILVSDGVDSESRYSFEDTLEFARRSGTAIYPIGIGISPRDVEGRRVLRLLARETGGTTFFIDAVRALDRVYEQIEDELRSQYLIGYQSTQSGSGFRRVELEVSGRGLSARTVPGYYP